MTQVYTSDNPPASEGLNSYMDLESLGYERGLFLTASTCSLIQKVGQQAAHDGLVTDDQHILLPLQLHDDWL